MRWGWMRLLECCALLANMAPLLRSSPAMPSACHSRMHRSTPSRTSLSSNTFPSLPSRKCSAEMLRVLKPGGRLILIELLIGQGGHVFSRTPQDWIQQLTSRGATLLEWFGQEFLLPDRLFLIIVHKLLNLKSRAGDEIFRPVSQSRVRPRLAASSIGEFAI